MKLDRLVARHRCMGRKAAHQRIAEGRVRLDGVVTTDNQREVSRFMRVEFDGAELQAAQRALYLMMHKPAGVLSATTDAQHPTVLDLIDDPDKRTLHLAGRLDRSTTGLLLLTNDGRWSKKLMAADAKVPKIYRVETLHPIGLDSPMLFMRGFHFHKEGIVTRPARLEILAERRARLMLHEGRHHQVKRMFHRVGNRVTCLHREQIGALVLPDDLGPGQWRPLSEEETQAATSSDMTTMLNDAAWDAW